MNPRSRRDSLLKYIYTSENYNVKVYIHSLFLAHEQIQYNCWVMSGIYSSRRHARTPQSHFTEFNSVYLVSRGG